MNRAFAQIQELESWASHLSSFEELPKRLIYVYYCEICYSVLTFSDKLDCRHNFLYTMTNECPTCHFKLDMSLRCHAINLRIPAEFLSKPPAKHHAFPHHLSTPSPISKSTPKLESLLNAKVIPLSSRDEAARPKEPLLSFGDDSLDGLSGGVCTHQLTVLYGDKICQRVAERLCVRSQLPIDKGGFDSASVFIDGGNSFDVYQVSNYASELHLDRDETLRRIKVSRAFTCYQLVNLIIEKLPELLCREEVGLVVIANLLDLFMDSEIEFNEIRQTVNFLSVFLVRFVRENNVALVVTCPTGKNRDDLLQQFVTSRAQVVLRAVRFGGGKPNFQLRKHPTKQLSQHG